MIMACAEGVLELKSPEVVGIKLIKETLSRYCFQKIFSR